jgi:hypothetical protein
VRVVKVNGERFATPDPAWSDAVRSEEELFEEPELRYPIVLVTWHDAWFDFDQQDPEDCRTDYLVRTVGFLVDDGSRFVSVAQEVLPDGDGFRAVTHIPRSIIERVTRLSEDPIAFAEAEVESASAVGADGPADPYTSNVVKDELRKEG